MRRRRELEKSDIRNKAKLIFCLTRYRVGSRWNPVYFKRINFPFDQRTGLLVCGVELTVWGEARRGLEELSNGEGGRGGFKRAVRDGSFWRASVHDGLSLPV